MQSRNVVCTRWSSWRYLVQLARGN